MCDNGGRSSMSVLYTRHEGRSAQGQERAHTCRGSRTQMGGISPKTSSSNTPHGTLVG